MGGPTSPGGLKEQATCLTPLFEHDDDDDEKYHHVLRGATRNFREFQYTVQTISATNLRC